MRRKSGDKAGWALAGAGFPVLEHAIIILADAGKAVNGQLADESDVANALGYIVSESR